MFLEKLLAKGEKQTTLNFSEIFYLVSAQGSTSHYNDRQALTI